MILRIILIQQAMSFINQIKNNKTYLFLKKFVVRFFQYNTRYRVFFLIAFGLFNLSVYRSEGFWGGLVFSFFFTVFETLLLVFILDKQFNRGIKLLIKWYNEKSKKEQEKDRKEWAEIWNFIKFFIKRSFDLIVAVIMSFLTRFPFFRDFYRNRTAHYEYRHIRELSNYIEKNCKGIYVNSVDIDKYYCTLSLVSGKSITAQEKQDKIAEVLKKYFNEDAQDIIIRPKGRLLQLLIPITSLYIREVKEVENS